MKSLSICFLLAFSSLFNCEHRGIYYSELVKKEPNYSLAMFYDDAATVLWCGVKCYNDNCCAQFLYDKTSKKCLGLHNFGEGVISFSQISGLSDKTEQYRKGNKSFWHHKLFTIINFIFDKIHFLLINFRLFLNWFENLITTKQTYIRTTYIKFMFKSVFSIMWLISELFQGVWRSLNTSVSG